MCSYLVAKYCVTDFCQAVQIYNKLIESKIRHLVKTNKNDSDEGNR
jgi:hypothetical protein